MIRSDLHAAQSEECRFITVERHGRAPGPRSPALGLCLGSPMRSEIEALNPSGSDAAVDAAAASIAERLGAGPFQTRLQAIVVETTR